MIKSIGAEKPIIVALALCGTSETALKQGEADFTKFSQEIGIRFAG